MFISLVFFLIEESQRIRLWLLKTVNSELPMNA